MSNYLTSPRRRLNPQLWRKNHLDSASEDGSLVAAIGTVCSGARYRQHLHETLAAHAEPGGPCNVCCVLQERASSVDAQRAGTEGGRPTLWRGAARCHQRSRSISSALVTGSHSLSAVSDCERNTDNIQYRPSNLFIFVTCQSPRQLKQLPAGLTWAEY